MTTILLAGDIMLGRGVNEALRSGLTPEDAWGDLLPVFESADLRIGNLECALTDNPNRWDRYEKAFYFGADPQSVQVLEAASFDAVSLANNHILDFEEEGLIDTLRTLDLSGIAHAGAGRNLHEAREAAHLPPLEPLQKRKVALLSATDNEPGFAATQTRPGTNYFPIDLDASTLAWIDEAVDRAREQGAETVILSLHWGPNMVDRPTPVCRRFAQAAIDRGVDIIHGHSAHVFHGIEIYRGKPILYDTGDLIDDYAVDPEQRNDWSFLFLLHLDRGEFKGLELVPIQLSYARTRLARGTHRKIILERMRARSRELGTELNEKDGILKFELKPEAA